MSVNANRIRTLNEKAPTQGPVLYWMDRDMRVHDNWALLYARECAKDRGVPLLVLYNLAPGFLGGTLRQYSFKVGALREIEQDLRVLSIPFYLVRGTETEKDIVAFAKKHAVGHIVTDFSPLRIQRKWKEYVGMHADVLLTEVDAHNIVPAWVASSKAEVGARTLRPKLHRLLPEYLEPFPKLPAATAAAALPAPIDWDAVMSDETVDRSVTPSNVVPGEKAVHKALAHFLNDVLPRYALERNDPLQDAQSNLSPYLHYGMLAPARAALTAIDMVSMPIQSLLDERRNAAKVDKKKPPTMEASVSAFLEELIVRRELSDNFCLYAPDTYDSTECFPAWAANSLKEGLRDKREHIYTLAEFENAQTHDELWNAAQKEMTRTGKMHGYMRMYWAKKILEWTRTPEDATKIAMYLNDRYELDGRDPNGYAGIAWSIGGVHDRAWFRRPIFGLVRYMARSGCDAKFDTKAYIARESAGALPV